MHRLFKNSLLANIVLLIMMLIGCDQTTGGYINSRGTDGASTSPIEPQPSVIPKVSLENEGPSHISLSVGHALMSSSGVGLDLNTSSSKKILKANGVGMKISIQSKRTIIK